MFRYFATAATIAAVILSVGAGRAQAQDRRVPISPTELKLSYAPIVQRVQPAVVNVYAAKVIQNRNPLLDDPIFRRFFGVPGQQPEQMQRSLGSGVMVDPSGLVVTNNHVIEGADQVRSRCPTSANSGRDCVETVAPICGAASKPKENFRRWIFNSDELLVGDVVLAIGNPFGVGERDAWLISAWRAQVASPIINSSFRPTPRSIPAIPAAGGHDGRLVGINTAIFSRSGVHRASAHNSGQYGAGGGCLRKPAARRSSVLARRATRAVTPNRRTLGLLASGALVISRRTVHRQAGLKLSDLIVDRRPGGRRSIRSIIISPPVRWARRRSTCNAVASW